MKHFFCKEIINLKVHCYPYKFSTLFIYLFSHLMNHSTHTQNNNNNNNDDGRKTRVSCFFS